MKITGDPVSLMTGNLICLSSTDINHMSVDDYRQIYEISPLIE